MSAHADNSNVHERMKSIRHKVLVLSGKGGVGKSTVAANLAVALSVAGKKVGLLDIDVHGPSIPKLFGVEGMQVTGTENSIYPFEVSGNLKLMSIGFLLRSSSDAVIWRGPMKHTVIKQFLGDVEWGELDYLIVDSPPGTGDEPLSIAQLIPAVDGAVIVTTPQDVALLDVSKCINFCRQLSLPVLGIVENMSGFICPHCGKRTDIFKSGGGEKMAKELGIPFLGRIPLDPSIVSSSDDGQPVVLAHPETEAGKEFARVAGPILALEDKVADEREKAASSEVDDSNITDGKRDDGKVGSSGDSKSDGMIRIAVPVSGGRLSQHFGHCEQFILYDVDEGARKVVNKEVLESPEHEPGLLPKWLHDKGANIIIGCGMGTKAQQLFAQYGVDVVTGAPSLEPEKIIESFLAGTLETDENICDH